MSKSTETANWKAPRSPIVVNPVSNLDWDEKGQVNRIIRSQEISPEFIDETRRMFEDSKERRSKEVELFARIPTIIYYAWLDEGFDPCEHTDEEVIARLRRDELDYFITSAKIDKRR